MLREASKTVADDAVRRGLQRTKSASAFTSPAFALPWSGRGARMGTIGAMTVKGLAIALVALSPAAHAQCPLARAAYENGRWSEAAELAKKNGESADFSLAARAALAACIVGGADCAAMIEAAQRDAQEALRRDRGNVEARLQLALALGMKGRRATVAEAVTKGYAVRGRTLLAEAMTRAPNEPWAHALVGAWHLEVLRRGGRSGALMYGASLTHGLAAFEKARTLAPSDGAIALQFAVALLELDARLYAPRAGTLLAAAAAAPTPDAFALHVQREAQRLGAVLADAGPQAAAEAAAKRFG
jgi:hypothetical protein